MLPEKKRNRSDDLTQNSLDPWTIFQKKNSVICWTICLGIWLFLSAENIVCGMAKTTSEKIRMTFQYFRSFVSFLHGFSLHFTDNCTKCCLQFLLFRVVFRCSMAALGSFGLCLWLSTWSISTRPLWQRKTQVAKISWPEETWLNQNGGRPVLFYLYPWRSSRY